MDGYLDKIPAWCQQSPCLPGSVRDALGFNKTVPYNICAENNAPLNELIIGASNWIMQERNVFLQ